MAVADFETLAARDGVRVREKVTRVAADRFAELRAEYGTMEWGVGAIATDDVGRVLLVKEDGRWLSPGGEVEPGETLTDALTREVREETGIEIVVDDLVSVTDVRFTNADREVGFRFAHYTVTPETTTLADDPGNEDEEIQTVAWVDELPADTVDRVVVSAHR